MEATVQLLLISLLSIAQGVTVKVHITQPLGADKPSLMTANSNIQGIPADASQID